MAVRRARGPREARFWGSYKRGQTHRRPQSPLRHLEEPLFFFRWAPSSLLCPAMWHAMRLVRRSEREWGSGIGHKLLSFIDVRPPRGGRRRHLHHGVGGQRAAQPERPSPRERRHGVGPHRRRSGARAQRGGLGGSVLGGRLDFCVPWGRIWAAPSIGSPRGVAHGRPDMGSARDSPEKVCAHASHLGHPPGPKFGREVDVGCSDPDGSANCLTKN